MSHPQGPTMGIELLVKARDLARHRLARIEKVLNQLGKSGSTKRLQSCEAGINECGTPVETEGAAIKMRQLTFDDLRLPSPERVIKRQLTFDDLRLPSPAPEIKRQLTFDDIEWD